MKLHLDTTVMQSNTVKKLIEIIDDLSNEVSRLSRAQSKSNEATKILIKKAKYVSSVREKEMSRLNSFKRTGSLNNFYTDDLL
jgi:hypothetical protein|tara:strand:+ start:6954 stop:7202 length:249 start_codon:yes stop_codon:yes gene_type:complete